MTKNASRLVAGLFILGVVLVGVFFVRSYQKRTVVDSESPFYDATIEKMKTDVVQRESEDDKKFGSDKNYVKITVQSGVITEPAYYTKANAKQAFTDVGILRGYYDQIKVIPVDPKQDCIKTLSELPLADLNSLVARNLKTDAEYTTQRLYLQKVLARTGFSMQRLKKSPNGFCGASGAPKAVEELKKLDMFLTDLEKAFKDVNVTQFQ